MGKWNDDRHANAANNRSPTSRAILPWCSSDGSNYDPDSDWDVDDTEVEYDSHIEDVFEARPQLKNNKDDGNAHNQIG